MSEKHPPALWVDRRSVCESDILSDLPSSGITFFGNGVLHPPSGAKSCTTCFSTVSREARSAPQHNANEFMSSGKALEVPKRSPGWDIAQSNAELVSVKFHTINFIGDWQSDEGQTFSCSAISLSSPFVTVIICKVLRLILLRTVKFGVSGMFTVARVWSSSPFHLAFAADRSQLIFAHLIWEENKGPRSFAWETRRHHEAQMSDPGVDARTHT